MQARAMLMKFIRSGHIMWLPAGALIALLVVCGNMQRADQAQQLDDTFGRIEAEEAAAEAAYWEEARAFQRDVVARCDHLPAPDRAGCYTFLYLSLQHEILELREEVEFLQWQLVD